MPKLPKNAFDNYLEGIVNGTVETKSSLRIPQQIFIGIDPGQTGGLVSISSGKIVDAIPMPSTERDICEWFRSLPEGLKNAVLEEVSPRPTFFKGKSSILKSTCLIYGHYRMLKGMLIALGIPFIEARPQEWMKSLSIPTGKNKEVTENKWKDYLRGKAQQLYPDFILWGQKGTKGKQLAIADAILLATYCQQKQEGRN